MPPPQYGFPPPVISRLFLFFWRLMPLSSPGPSGTTRSLPGRKPLFWPGQDGRLTLHHSSSQSRDPAPLPRITKGSPLFSFQPPPGRIPPSLTELSHYSLLSSSVMSTAPAPRQAIVISPFKLLFPPTGIRFQFLLIGTHFPLPSSVFFPSLLRNHAACSEVSLSGRQSSPSDPIVVSFFFFFNLPIPLLPHTPTPPPPHP